MVYGSEAPAKIAEVRSPLGSAVHALINLDSLEILGKLVRNCAVSPKEEKYRKIKLSNPTIARTIGSVPEAMHLLQMLGWTQVAREGGEELVLPLGTFMKMDHVRQIEDQKNVARKEAHKQQVQLLKGK